MISLLIALALSSPSLAQSLDQSRAQDEYEYSKAQEYRVELTRYGTSRPALILEKSNRNRICQKVANAAPYTHYEYNCFSVDEVGSTAQETYEKEESTELDVKFRAEGGYLLGTGIRQKYTARGFCRVSETSSARPYYLCYSR